ncbi:MAG: nucleotide exchange factor GrpE [Chloroflexi bacterium]|nr:nucleotide exchange factor GrpE [Chloroflexota bacterium]
MSDRFRFDEEIIPVPPSALDADPATAMTNLLYRVSKLEQSLTEEQQQAIADTRDLLMQITSLSDDVARVVERWGVTSNAKEAAIMQSVVAFGRKILAILDYYGVKPIDTLNKPLDPRTSEVVGTEVRDRLKPDTVLREAQLGYTWRHGLLRKARVVVSRSSTEATGRAGAQAGQATPSADAPHTITKGGTTP